MNAQTKSFRKYWLLALVAIGALVSAGCGASSQTDTGAGLPSSTVSQQEIPPGEICPNGGAQVNSGIDENGNGLLDTEEIDETVYVCHGLPGLVTATFEPSGVNCDFGGTKIQTGLDDNGNGLLDRDEVTDTSYVCSPDNIPPDPPQVTGSVPTATNANPLKLSGTKDANSSVWINKLEVAPLDTTTSWSADITLAVNRETRITMISVDQFHNQSGAVTFTVVHDTIAPAPPVVGKVPGQTNNPELTLSGTREAFSSVWIGNGRTEREIAPVDSLGSTEWKGSYTLAEGDNSISVYARDEAGNSSKSGFSGTVLLDSTAPVGLTVVNPAPSGTNLSPQLLSGAKEANSSVWINGVEVVPADVAITWSFEVALVEGVNTFTVTSKDSFGNESAVVRGTVVSIVYDTIPPANLKGFTATSATLPGGVQQAVELSWTAAAKDVAFIMIRRNSFKFPVDEFDGVEIGAAEFSPKGVTLPLTDDIKLREGSEYFYTAFTKDSVGNVSLGAHASAIPTTPPPAGGLDTSFGKGGFWLERGTQGAHGNAVAFLPLAKAQNFKLEQEYIFVTGTVAVGETVETMALWRLTADGTPDTKFGGDYNGDSVPDGYLQFGAKYGAAGNAVMVDSIGRIVVAGSVTKVVGKLPATLNTDLALWRFLPTGVPDQTFGEGGLVVYQWISDPGDDAGLAIAEDVNLGRILVSGYAGQGARGVPQMAVWAFDRLGVPDTVNFNSRGTVPGVYLSGDNTAGNAIAVGARGIIAVAGYQGLPGARDMALWRLTAAGVLDEIFNRGAVIIRSGDAGGTTDDEGTAVAFDSALDTANIVVAGYSTNPDTKANADMVVWRFTSAGEPDTANFGGGKGFLVHGGAAGGTEGDDVANALLIDANGKIVVAGYSLNGDTTTPTSDLVVWRLTAAGALEAGLGGFGEDYDLQGDPDGFLIFKYKGWESAAGLAFDAKSRILAVGSMEADAKTPASSIGDYMLILRVIP